MDLKEEIKLLVVLQEKDVVLNRLRNRCRAIPEEIAAKKTFVAELRAELESKKSSITQFQLKRKEKEIELESKDNEIKKHNMELNSIKSNAAYKALLSEIETCKKSKNDIENEILDLMETIEKETLTFKDGEKELKIRETEVQSENSKLEDELRKITEETAVLEKERNEFAKNISPELLARYEYIRERRDGVAVAHIEGENCSECRMILRPQVINDVYKIQDLIVCDTCSRILYKK